MTTIVLGAGVIGVTLAYYLAKKGEKVIVMDKASGPGLDTSFANAGQISPGYASPWAAPGVPLKAVRWLLQKHAPLGIQLDGSWAQISWMIQMLQNCNATAYARNKARMVRLAEYSRNEMRVLRDHLPLSYEGRQKGTLQVFRTPQQMEDVLKKDVPVLQEMNVAFKVLEGAQITQAEPALKNVTHKLVGGLQLLDDETGDCYLFTQQMAELAKNIGVEFKYGHHITQILSNGAHIEGVMVNGVKHTADHIVVALASYSKDLLADHLNIPVYPVKGYSMTADIIQADHAPESTVLDETYKIAITRLGQRIRVGGMAHVMGFNLESDPRKENTLRFVLDDLFTDAGQLDGAKFWCGLRPMTPDGTPIVGQTPIKGLWLNTGHGTLGWTMAAGSAAVLSDLITQAQPAIQYADLSVMRYHKPG